MNPFGGGNNLVRTDYVHSNGVVTKVFDGPQGVVQSDPIVLGAEARVEFQAAGDGGHIDLVDLATGEILESVSPALQSVSLASYTIDASEHAGKVVVLRIVDDQSGGWGHIAVDNIVLTAQPIRDSLIWDFEAGNLSDSTGGNTFSVTSGTAFAGQPIPYGPATDNVDAVNPFGGGNNLVRTDYVNSNGLVTKVFDGPQGVVQSDPIVLGAEARVEFQAAGDGGHIDLVDLATGDILESVSPALQSVSLASYTMDASEHAGKVVVLRIVDDQSGGWGHIAVDNIVLTAQPIGDSLDFGTFDGQIAIMRFYDSSLTDDHVRQNYSALVGTSAIEGATASYTQAFATPGSELFEMNASIGSVLDNGDGTWTWSYETVNGPEETQFVTVTSSEIDSGPSISTTFPLQVLNAAPNISLQSDAMGAPIESVLAGPNQPALHSGSFSDPGNDAISFSANFGTVTDAGNGIWNWSLDVSDDSLDGQTVVVTATDSDGATSSVSFQLEVDAEAPQVTLAHSMVTANEGDIATNSGTYSDENVVAMDASSGIITDHGDGTWGWSYTTDDGDRQIPEISVTATDAAGNQATSMFSLDILDVPPTVNLSLDATTIDEGSTVTLNVDDWADPGIDFPTQYIIDWGDGQSDTIEVSDPAALQSLQHAYADGAANNTISITVVDEDGAHTLAETVGVHVLNVRPTITSFNVPASADEGDFIQLSAAATDAAGAADPLIFAWTIVAPDGSTTSANGDVFGFTAAVGHAGTYNVSLKVSDDDGGVTIQESTIEVQGSPVANAGGPYLVDEGGSVVIDGAFASDPNQDTETLTYLWDFDGDGTFGEIASEAQHGDEVGIDAVFAAGLLDGPTIADIALRVVDERGLTSDSQTTITVRNVAPTVPAQTFFVDEGAANDTFVGQVAASDFIGDSLSFAITGGTGQAVFNIDSNTGELTLADASQVNHSTTPTFTLDVQVTDDDGGATTATMTVRVEDVGSLEVVGFQIDDGDPQRSNIDLLSIRFNEDANVDALIQSGNISDAVQLIGPFGIPVNLDDGRDRFSYDQNTFTLNIDLTIDLPGNRQASILLIDGDYELRLDSSQIHESDGSHTLLDTDGTDDGVVRFAFQRVLGDFDGNGVVNLTDRALFFQGDGTMIGDADYNDDFDLDRDREIDFIDYVIFRSRLPRRGRGPA